MLPCVRDERPCWRRLDLKFLSIFSEIVYRNRKVFLHFQPSVPEDGIGMLTTIRWVSLCSCLHCLFTREGESTQLAEKYQIKLSPCFL